MKRIMIFLGVTLILLASCADFLDPESKSEYIPEDVSSLNSLLILERVVFLLCWNCWMMTWPFNLQEYRKLQDLQA